MSFTREMPGHWKTDATSAAWLADADIDQHAIGTGTRAVTFTARAEVETGSTATVQVRSGGDPETTGSTLLAFVVIVGPHSGAVTGAASPGVGLTQGSSPIALHLCLHTSSAVFPVELWDFDLAVA